MNYYYKTPPPALSRYVNGILVIEDFKAFKPFTMPLFANGCPTLVFQTKKALVNNQSAGHFTLFGQTIKPGAFTIQEDFTLLAYFFKPHVLVSLFNLDGCELRDTNVDLNLLKHADSKDIQEKLLDCVSADEMIALLNSYIHHLIRKKSIDPSRIDLATSLVSQNAGSDSLKSAQDNLCMTEKTFQRMFENKVGISPRLYRRICQFNAAFQQLSERKFSKLSEVAYRNNYADQSHFIRSFREFTNLTPREYIDFSTPGSR